MTEAKLIVGNWKMNGMSADSLERVEQLMAGHTPPSVMVLCPPATMIAQVAWKLGSSGIELGGQDCHAESSGAFTGDVSAAMLKDLKCKWVILGHSERRQHHKETSEQVAAKAKAAHATGLTAIICIGETDAERTAGKEEEVVGTQLKNSIPDTATDANTVIAYEPIWAIGTGKTASAYDIKKMHDFIRVKLEEKNKATGSKMRILYGGSVKAANAREIMLTPNVDGVLVGGASLKADEFILIEKSTY